MEVPRYHPVRIIRIFFQTKNSGKGAALRAGLCGVYGHHSVQDADLEYDPRDYPNFSTHPDGPPT